MAQGIYDLLQQTLKLTTRLNKQLCCEPPVPSTTTSTSTTTTTTVPPTTTTSSTSTTSTSTTSTSTTTTTTIPDGFFRTSWLIAIDSALPAGFIANRASWYNGNTVAGIAATNPDFVYNVIVNYESTGYVGIQNTRTLRETISSTPVSVSPTYTSFDAVTGWPIMKSLKEQYAWVVKIVNNTFLATRNPSIFIKRVYSANGLGSGVPLDGIFLIGVDFNATGLERDGYNVTARTYNQVTLPGTWTLPGTYNAYFGSPYGGSASNIAMQYFSPSTTWVNGVTNIIGTIIEEDFPIPPGW